MLAVSVEEFFGDNLVSNIATLLNIDPSRIKIVEVHAGSVSVSVEILDNTPPVSGPVVSIQDTINDLIAANTLNLGYKVTAANATLATDYGQTKTATATPTPSPSRPPSATATPTFTRSVTATRTDTPSVSRTRSVTPTVTPSRSLSRSDTVSVTRSRTASATVSRSH